MRQIFVPLLLVSALSCQQSVRVAAAPAPVGPVEYRVAVVGDNQVGANVFALICRSIRSERVDLLCGLGDHIQNGGQIPSEWLTQWAQPIAAAGLDVVPRVGCVGNHDDAFGYQRYVWPTEPHDLGGGVFGLWRAVTLGSVRWVFLDTREDVPIQRSLAQGGQQHAFVQSEIASQEWQAARWRVVAFHHPHKTEYWDGGCYYPALPDRVGLVSLLASSGAHVVLNGHAHAYQRGMVGPGTAWFISGGGGGYLDTAHCWDWPEITRAEPRHHYLTIDVAPTALTVRACDPSGVEFDRVVVR